MHLLRLCGLRPRLRLVRRRDRALQRLRLRPRAVSARAGSCTAHHESESHALSALRDDEGVRLRIGEPVRDLVGLAMTDLAQDGEDSGVERGKIVEVVAIDAFDPQAIGLRKARITNADRHRSTLR